MTKPCRGLVDCRRWLRLTLSERTGPQDHVLILWSDTVMSIPAVESGFTKLASMIQAASDPAWTTKPSFSSSAAAPEIPPENF
jgi:hypothetical protein